MLDWLNKNKFNQKNYIKLYSQIIEMISDGKLEDLYSLIIL